MRVNMKISYKFQKRPLCTQNFILTIKAKINIWKPQLALYPSGKGEVCKTFIQRFESARRLFFYYPASIKGPGGGIGRHKGLKIPWTFGPCGFNSRPGHHLKYHNPFTNSTRSLTPYPVAFFGL